MLQDILQYFRPSLGYHLSLRPLFVYFCLMLLQVFVVDLIVCGRIHVYSWFCDVDQVLV